jgi:toxin ParE1/3/4
VSGSFTLTWTQTAVDDLLSIIDDGAEAAERLYAQFTAGVATLETLAFRCRVVPELEAEGIETYRGLLVGPYRLLFAVRGGEIVLLTAVDGRRDLGELLIERALRERDRPAQPTASDLGPQARMQSGELRRALTVRACRVDREAAR